MIGRRVSGIRGTADPVNDPAPATLGQLASVSLIGIVIRQDSLTHTCCWNKAAASAPARSVPSRLSGRMAPPHAAPRRVALKPYVCRVHRFASCARGVGRFSSNARSVATGPMQSSVCPTVMLKARACGNDAAGCEKFKRAKPR